VVSGLIAGLLGLVLVGGLVMFIRGRKRPRPSADDTLVTDLLGPPDRPAIPAPHGQQETQPAPAPRAPQEAQPAPAPQAPQEAQPAPAPQAPQEAQPAPAPRAREEAKPAPAPSAPPAREDDWLETQLAWISAWSRRMNQQLTSAEQSEPDSKE
jgi:outer membrane biosynthesis protein TonB